MKTSSWLRRPALELLEGRTVPAVVRGVVFEDLNGNGGRDAGEAGLPGWTVFLDGNPSLNVSPNTVADPGEATQLTDANGAFEFTGVSPPYTYVSRALEIDRPGFPAGRWVPTTAGTMGANLPEETSEAEVAFGVKFSPFAETVPVGGETLVNVSTAGAQGNQVDYSESATQTVAADALGNFAVVWRSYAGTGSILVRLFNANGTPRSGEITVGASTTDNMPRVAMADNGRFAVAWDTRNSSTTNNVVYARAYAADGTPLSGAVQVTPISSTARNNATGIAMDADGDFAVLYKGEKKSGPFWNAGLIGFQRYTALGQAAGNNTQVVDAVLVNGHASIAMADTGGFVVVWDEADGGHFVYAQRYTSAGKKTGSQITVASAANISWWSSVAMNGAGQFVVAWSERNVGAWARVYSATGTPTTSPFAFDNDAGERKTSVAIDADGSIVLSWQYWDEIHFARRSAAGVLGLEYVVNTTTQGYQVWPAVALTGTGSFVVSWNGYGVGDDAGVFFQRYGPAGSSGPAGRTASSPGGGEARAALVDAALARPPQVGVSPNWGDVAGLLESFAATKRRGGPIS